EKELKTFKRNIADSHKKANVRFTLFAMEQDIFSDLPNRFAELKFAFEPLYGTADFMDKIGKMTLLLRSLFLEKEDVINMEFLFCLDNIIARLHEINDCYSDGITVQNLFYIFGRLLKNIKVPFSGEPIGGLQVMGMLETRLLDYKNVILLSVNENIIPSKKKTSTYIPYDIRLHFSLPTHHDHHAVEAYHFYRLLQRAENIYIFYNTDSGSGVGAKEKSRFISQLIHELPAYNSSTEVVEIEENNDIAISTEGRLTIPKSPFALKRINEIAQVGFSSSTINDYLNYPIDFYLKHIVGIPETPNFSNGIDAKTFGHIIHETIEQTHQHLIGKQLVARDIEKIFDLYKPILEQNFEKNWIGGEYKKGKNLLTFIVADDYIRAFLEYEQREIETANRENRPYTILLQEQKITAPIKLLIGDECKEIMLKGVIDRVVKIGNVVRIIDFKTGNVENKEIRINDIARFVEEKYSQKAIQLLIYSWLMRASGQVSDTSDLEAGIISFRRLSHGFLPLRVLENETVGEEALTLITNILTEILQEIFNPDIPFTALDNPDVHIFSSFEMLY
ncbi:MAG: PD-(D/E)XK nuclease family protein, partial [Bacteroidales bacterium]|nr:PD-(D/E)XK nuclease family protein [Bacteroidales bacterium]